MTNPQSTDAARSIRSCPLCGSGRNRFFEHLEHPTMTMDYRICQDCGFVFQSYIWQDSELVEYYSSQYRVQMEQSDSPTERVRAIENARARLLTRKLIASGVVPHRHLDIGCSTGAFLLECNRKFGCLGTGVEPGNSYRSFAQERGLEVLPSLEELVVAPEDRYDLVSLIHVMEHLPDPVGTLTDLRETTLAPDGLLLVEVPNLYAHDSLEPAHISAFSPHTLEQALKKAGYYIHQLWLHGQPRSNVLQLYITALAKPSRKTITHILPEELVVFRRKISLIQRRVLQKLMPRQTWLPYPPLEE